jgi:hypothetical protein
VLVRSDADALGDAVARRKPVGVAERAADAAGDPDGKRHAAAGDGDGARLAVAGADCVAARAAAVNGDSGSVAYGGAAGDANADADAVGLAAAAAVALAAQ